MKSIKAVIEEKEQEYNNNSEKRLRETKCPHGRKFGIDNWFDVDVCKDCLFETKCANLLTILEESGEV